MYNHCYNFSEIGNAPDVPGLYAWYQRLDIGLADIETDQAFFDIINHYDSQDVYSCLEVQAKLHFGLSWKGDIARASSENNENRQSLRREQRDLIKNILDLGQHLFYRPLYIGVATKSLLKRLSQHKTALIKNAILEESDDVTLEDKQFADRAQKANFAVDDLCCYVLPLSSCMCDSGSVLTDDEASQVLKIAEAKLNAWATPPLGRR